MPPIPSLWTWITLPLIGGIIGLGTNWIAVKMIFRPVQPWRLFWLFPIQGLVPRRQRELARSIGAVVGTHLVEHKDIVRGLGKLDFDRLLGAVIDQGLTPKIQELRSLPLIGGFLTEDRVRSVRDAIQNGVLDHKQTLLDQIERGLEQGLDVPALVEEKVGAFPVLKLEQLILDVARRELAAITWLGGVLGAIIGLGQVACVWFLG